MAHPVPLPPGPGQESVWDYPRPPALAASGAHVLVAVPDGPVVADTTRAVRVLETSHPPSWYLPPQDVRLEFLRRSSAPATVCEFKGRATYWDVVVDGSVLSAALWSYEEPAAGYESIAGYLACMPSRFDCSVDGEVVRPQDGGFYGGWITADVVGPFKGGPGTWGW